MITILKTVSVLLCLSRLSNASNSPSANIYHGYPGSQSFVNIQFNEPGIAQKHLVKPPVLIHAKPIPIPRPALKFQPIQQQQQHHHHPIPTISYQQHPVGPPIVLGQPPPYPPPAYKRLTQAYIHPGPQIPIYHSYPPPRPLYGQTQTPLPTYEKPAARVLPAPVFVSTRAPIYRESTITSQTLTQTPVYTVFNETSTPTPTYNVDSGLTSGSNSSANEELEEAIEEQEDVPEAVVEDVAPRDGRLIEEDGLTETPDNESEIVDQAVTSEENNIESSTDEIEAEIEDLITDDGMSNKNGTSEIKKDV